MSESQPSTLQAKGLVKSFREGRASVSVLNQLDFTLTSGETVAIVGRSGCGKSTLLHTLGGLDRPSEGTVTIGDAPFSTRSPKERARLRNRHLGFVYQFHHLLPEFSALENVALAPMIGTMGTAEAKAEAERLLTLVGLKDRLDHRPAELSGGERQRVAVARALVTRPAFVLADEPTGNLDGRSATEVLDLMLELNERTGAALLIVTHDTDIAARMGRTLTLEEGRLVPA